MFGGGGVGRSVPLQNGRRVLLWLSPPLAQS
eukprot:COSAG02_NODE_20701_length_818_cov_1.748261_2_plen_30_part_01